MEKSPDEVINTVLSYIKSRGSVLQHPVENLEYYGLGQKRTHNIRGKVGNKTVRICVRTQFTGGGAWQKMIYTYQMMDRYSEDDCNYIVYFGTDKRFIDHCKWINENYSKHPGNPQLVFLPDLPIALDNIG